jgi:hypothetical protein
MPRGVRKRFCQEPRHSTSLALIGSLLGHSTPAVTSHLFDSVERDAVTRVGAIIEAAGLDQPPSALFRCLISDEKTASFES